MPVWWVAAEVAVDQGGTGAFLNWPDLGEAQCDGRTDCFRWLRHRVPFQMVAVSCG